MRLLLIFTSTIVLLLALAYTILFTTLGNNLLKPMIESKINKASAIKVTLDEFYLRIDKFKVLIKLDPDNTLLAEGTYSIFDKNFDIQYLINLSKLSTLRELSKRQLSGELVSHGTIQGDIDLFKIKGESTLAKGETEYALILKEMQLDKAAIKTSNVNLQELLSMIGEKPYATGKINLHLQLNELDPKKMQGNVLLALKEAKLNAKTVEKEFGVKLSRTALDADLKANLSGENLTYLLDLNSELASLSSKGSTKIEGLVIDADYKIDIKELALLKSLTNAPLRGPFLTQGTVKGDEKVLKVQGSSNLADSKSSYAAELKAFKPRKIILQINNAELSKLLFLAGESSYATGKVDLNADVSSLSPLKAAVNISLSKGVANTGVIQKAFDLTLPYTYFDFLSTATIANDKLDAKTEIRSNLANLDMKQTRFELKTATLTSDYLIFIPSLEKLEPILKRKLKGQLTANGEIKKDQKLSITAHSDIFKGKLNAKVIDEKINADFSDIQAVEALKMLGYPQVMNAPIRGTLNYDTKLQQGKLDTRFDKAVLTRSKMTDLIGTLTNSDLTKERFNEGTLQSDINREIIDTKVQMHSEKVSLKSKKFIMDTKKQLIDARFSLMVKEQPGDVVVTGDINSPKVTLDAKSMITPQIKEKAAKEINRFLKKLF